MRVYSTGMKRIVALFVFCSLALGMLAAQAATSPAQKPVSAVKVAFISVRNLDVDPRSDYVGGIIQGLLLYDLTRTPNVALIDRSSLDRVLAEQELQLSGLIEDRGSALKVGGLLGADYLVYAEYVAFASEALVTVRVVSVSSGRAGAFAERGGSENVVHRAAESLVEYLTGSRPQFAGAAGERGIVSLRDEAPGSVALHSHLIRAEIFLDGEFAGYTTGAIDKPFMIEKLAPGPHTLRVHLGRGFGVVKLPQVEFADWEAAFELKPGERKVLRDQTRDFNSVLYDLLGLLDEDLYYTPETAAKAAKVYELSFTDRTGVAVPVRLALKPVDNGGLLELRPELSVGGLSANYSLKGIRGEETSLDVKLGLLRFRASIDMRYDRTRLDFSLDRADIWQGMYND
jgi:TolB-like protein